MNNIIQFTFKFNVFKPTEPNSNKMFMNYVQFAFMRALLWLCGVVLVWLCLFTARGMREVISHVINNKDTFTFFHSNSFELLLLARW